jgi:hypothetical protein
VTQNSVEEGEGVSYVDARKKVPEVCPALRPGMAFQGIPSQKYTWFIVTPVLHETYWILIFDKEILFINKWKYDLYH